ncbi:Uncharacterised protein [Vibrio cholerae]|uniref:Uncharacterized protein n=1 Tax=Vibrio cholerae TaxID=666 RepID=A0A656AFR7_VIBCL|nr:Uncharacterised protein [Vibrio cholerae]CSD07885.1 Uncharacterised protein [Vibrio cholerae]CSD30013.1 Uncharacterised protein [Vibrio cholerae]CSI55669.1 Uncharacterised protein [Vibrio cholerae]
MMRRVSASIVATVFVPNTAMNVVRITTSPLASAMSVTPR